MTPRIACRLAAAALRQCRARRLVTLHEPVADLIARPELKFFIATKMLEQTAVQ